MRNDETRFTDMKSEFDGIKVQLGIAMDQRNKIQQELKEKYKVKSTKEIAKLLETLNSELKALREKKDALFDHINSRLQEYRR